MSDKAMQAFIDARGYQDKFAIGDLYLLLPVRGALNANGKYEVLSVGILRPGVTHDTVLSRRKRFAAMLRATLASAGICQRCIAETVEEALPRHLSWPGDDTRLYCPGGFYSRDGVTFGALGKRLRAEGHDLTGDPRFSPEWADRT